MGSLTFEILGRDGATQARRGRMRLAHGTVETPMFMPVGTRGSVKTLTHRQLEEVGTEIILGNTYHLYLRPGMEVIEKAGGLHAFIGWDHPILTDSGGFQVFSLSSLNKITDEGVHFQSHIDGKKLFIGPDESMAIQKTLGSDIVMAFDECSPFPGTREAVEKAWLRTEKWARRCRDTPLHPHQNLFGIVQGGAYEDLRRTSATSLKAMDFDGYGIGGLSVGEPAPIMYEMLDITTPELPEEKPRYLMGVGTPRNLVEGVKRGVDLFDCVLPTRNARNGTAYTWQGKIHIKAGRYAADFSPLDPELNCYASRFSKAYIRHLLNVHEITGLTLTSMQNIAFFLDFMRQLRQSLDEGRFDAFYERICAIYPN